MAYTSVNKSADNFSAITYSGNSSNPRNVTGVGFNPDLTVVKNRTGSNGRGWITADNVRGASKNIVFNETTAEFNPASIGSGGVSALITDGFTTVSGTSQAENSNQSGYTYVAYNWKANGSGSANTDGYINSTVSANQSAGISIVKYTGNGSVTTVGHGLGAAPKLIIVKRLTGGTEAWPVDDRSQGGILYLNETGALGSYGDSSPFPTTAPTTTVFSIGTANNTNASGSDFIAYCFAEKVGFSQVGKYIGLTDSGTEASMDDSFIYTGFAPQWLMVKKTNSSGTGWFVFDRARDTYNYASKFLMPQAANVEDNSTSRSLDFLSNGFKFRGSSDDVCGAGSTYFYVAFGQSMVGTNNIPNLAR